MALNDINFQEGEGQNFINEIPSASYAGVLNDFLIESDGSQNLLSEIPSGQGNIFIMSE